MKVLAICRPVSGTNASDHGVSAAEADLKHVLHLISSLGLGYRTWVMVRRDPATRGTTRAVRQHVYSDAAEIRPPGLDGLVQS